MSRAAWFAAALTLAPAGAAGAADYVAPLITLGDRSCVTAPDLSLAAQLVYAGREQNWDIIVDGTAHCVQTGAGPVLYRAFRLPETSEPYILTLASVPTGGSVLLPHLMMLDAHGAVKRELTRDDFMFRGTGVKFTIFDRSPDFTLSTRIRSHSDETYLVVESDAGAVGKAVTQTTENVNSFAAPVGTGVMVIHTGTDNTAQFTYTHTGKLQLKLEPVPKP